MNWVSIFKAIILGIVEGATEFIPVSSTGHLVLTQNLLHFTGSKENAFVIFIQLGAILAVLWLYRQKIFTLVWNWRTLPQAQRLAVNLVVATLPAVLIGLPTENWIEAHFFQPIPVSLVLILGGVAILLVERWSPRATVASMDDIPLAKALGVGLIQVLAILFPGMSRSATTILGGVGLGLSRVAATEFSFFLAIPALLGASVIKLYGARDVLTMTDVPIFLVGFVVSFVVALVVIRWLLAYVSHHSFVPFAWYRIIFGFVFLGLFLWLV